MVVSIRVRRGGLSLVLWTQGGRTLIGLCAGDCKELPDGISCSLVGLYNVLSGIEYLAVDSGKQCLVRLQEAHVEMVWKRGSVDAIFRLSVPEYRSVLSSLSEGTRGAA